ncbi:GNAT family N-acetyltransferase [Cohnella rhizosphaerae]|uniref:GNAT family N-acetyltransferase n=1 Tax=Cohnella rhizosphaerae TaxID=1457232 RepID=A0A9X4L007_9BACL|nr:GNAT family N-acetyltransferase [Cohnella rhizosphaerae]MDG0810997.1 GNAT family N-acetyltransferase [Cohnella rhizosphaerae]
MDIRHLTLDDFDERIALSEFAFQFKLPQERRETELQYFRPEEHLGAFDEQGKLLSALMLLPFRVWVNGVSVKMGGIASVATWPEARRHGCVSRLLSVSLKKMREQGQTVSMLHPFSFAFYRKFGWEMTSELKKYELEPRHFPSKRHTPGSVERIAPNTAAVAELYAKAASRYTGMLDRDEEWWTRKRWTMPGLLALYRNEAGEPEGYVHYQVENRVMTVLEWVSVTEKARSGLWEFVGNHDSMIERLKMTVPMDDPLPFLVADPRFKQETHPYFMTRIVDAEAFLSQYRFASGPEETLSLRLQDAHAPWNDGAFLLSIGTDGKAALSRAEADPAATVTMDIQSLAALLLGGRRPGMLAEAGRLDGKPDLVALLERRVPAYETFLTDFF